MSSPVRVQRRRTKGFKLQSPNELPVLYVGRPHKLGNPFKLIADTVYINAAHRRKHLDQWVFLCDGKNLDYVVWLYSLLFKDNQQWLCYPSLFQNHSDFLFWHDEFSKVDLSELKNKNFACFCPLDKPCHADILLKIVNGE